MTSLREEREEISDDDQIVPSVVGLIVSDTIGQGHPGDVHEIYRGRI